MAKSKYSIETIFKAIDQFTAPINKMTGSSKKFSRILKDDFAKAERQLMKFGDSFSRTMKNSIMIGSGLAIAGLSFALKEGIQLASDLTEVQNVVDTTFGQSRKQIDQWSMTAINAFGLSQLQAKKFTGTMGAMLKSSGISEDKIVSMSTSLTGLTGDFASFYNLPHEEAFAKIRSGISGETEPLKQIGINMSVANLEAFALTQGITKQWKSMSQAEQVLLRYNFLMKSSKDAQGDFAKTLSTSFANQQRILKTKFMDKLAVAMSKLLPLLIVGAQWLNNLLDKIDANKLADNIKIAALFTFKFAKGLGFLLKILQPFIPIILSALIAWKLYRLGLITAIAVQWAMNAALTANPIGLVIVAIGVLIGLVILMVIYWKQIVKWLTETWTWLVKVYDQFKGLIIIFAPMLIGFMNLIEVIRAVINNWQALVQAFKTEGILGGILALGKVILQAVLAPVESLFNLLGKIPGVGKMFKEWGLNIGELRGGLFEGQAPISPQEKSVYTKEEKTSKGELLIKDKTGTAEMKNKPTGNNFNIKLQKSGAF